MHSDINLEAKMSTNVAITKKTMELPAGAYLDTNYKLYYADGTSLLDGLPEDMQDMVIHPMDQLAITFRWVFGQVDVLPQEEIIIFNLDVIQTVM